MTSFHLLKGCRRCAFPIVGFVLRARHLGGGSAPKPVRPAESPRIEDKAVQEAAAEAARRKQRSRGYRSTVVAKNMMTDDSYNKALAETLAS